MSDTPTTTVVPPRPRPRSPIRKVEVERVDSLSPLMRRVVFRGEELAGFGTPRPAAHIKLHMVPQGASWSPADEAAPRPPRRTYTPRSYDPVTGRLVVDFLLHGHGLASTWAAGARPGQTLYVSGPGGGYDVPAEARSVVLVADDTALPAAGMILEALPEGCRAMLLAEVADRGEERSIAQSGAFDVKWLSRAEGSATPGALLEAAVRAHAADAADAYWWIACEAASMRRIRQHLIAECKVAPARVHTRGYWKHGETAYPDHDYGAD